MADEWYIDYSDGPRTGQFVKSGNIAKAADQAAYPTGVFRYATAPELANPPGRLQKHITPSEYGSLLAAGLKIRFFFQGSTTDADGGFDAGVRNARLFERGLEWIGAPKQAVAFTNDRTTLPSPQKWQQYLDGAASVLGFARVGAYGFRNAIDAAQGHAAFFVQCGSRSVLHPNANYWQDNNFQPRPGGRLTDRILVIRDYSVIGGGPSTKETQEMTRYEAPAAKGASEDPALNDPGYIQVEPGGGANAFVRIIPGQVWEPIPTEENPDAGHWAEVPVWVEHFYRYDGDGTGQGGDPGEQGAVTKFDKKVTTVAMPGTALCGIGYSSAAPFVVITG